MTKQYRTLHRRGFTLIELLVVIGIIAILASILIPALQRARAIARRTLCGTGLHHIGVGLRLYANEFNDFLPLNEEARWLWDVSYYTTDQLMEYGVDRKAFYCPSNPVRTADKARYWQYTQNPPTNEFVIEQTSEGWRKDQYRVTSYFWLMDNARGWPAGIVGSPERWFIKKLNVEFAEEWELVTDATLSAINSRDPDAVGNTFTEIQGGAYSRWGEYDRTNHVEGNKPLGTQILYADSHVKWRDFAETQFRYKASYTPFHWW